MKTYDLKKNWEWLVKWQQKDTSNNLDLTIVKNESIKQLKKQIRNFYKFEQCHKQAKKHFIHADNSSYWTLTKFSSEYAPYKIEIMENMKIERIPSLYDCTGSQFTIALDILPLKDGSFFVYHLVGLDV